MIYFDQAATSFPKAPDVGRAMAWAVSHYGSPGRGGYSMAMEAGNVMLECREKVAELFGMESPEKAIFTSGATESLNIAIFSVVKPGMNVLISGYEHNSVVRPVLAAGGKLTVIRAVPFSEDLFLHRLEKMLPTADAVILTAVSNVFGNALPVEKAGALCQKAGIPYMVDGSQAAGHRPLRFPELGADFLAVPGHKGLLGPAGIGLLLCGDREVRPLKHGGTGTDSMRLTVPDFLPERLEAGTVNMPGIAGLSRALDFFDRQSIEAIHGKECRLARHLICGLDRIPNIRVFADREKAPDSGVVSFLIEGQTPEETAAKLADLGMALRAGLHCAPLAHQTEGTLPLGTVRASLGVFTQEWEIQQLLRAIERIAK